MLTQLPDQVRDKLPEAVRPVLEHRPESAGLYEVLGRS